jgi:hypothetical protein
MSGGGGDDVVRILPVAAALAATVMTDGAAAPLLGEALGAEAGTVGASMLGNAVIGSAVGGTSAALTGGDVGRGILTGGATGAITSGVGGMMDNSFASGLSTDAANGIGPGASTTQIGGQEFNQKLYDVSDAAGYPGANNQYVPPTVTPTPTPNPNLPTQPFDAAGYSGAANQVPGTNTGYQQIGANNPQLQSNPNTTTSSEVGAKSAPSVNTKVTDTGIFGTGITNKQALVGLGGLALYNAIKNENKKYGVPATQNQVPANLNYTMAQHTPMQLTRSYAQGGSVAMPNMNNSPIRHQIAANSIGGNQMFPQPGIHSNQFANPTNTPVPVNMLAPTTDTAVDPYSGQQKMAAGGIAQSRLGGYAAGGNSHLLKGPGDGMSDNIPATIGSKQPARLADGEFVVPADVVSHLGNGSTDAGAKKLHSMMDSVRKARTGKKAQGKQIKADKYMPKFADGGQVDPIAAAAQAAQAANQNFVAQQVPAMPAPAQTMAPQGLGATAPAQTMAPAPMAQQFANYQNTYAQDYAPTNENFVRHEYMKSFGREPDKEGAQHWVDALNKGYTPQQVQEAVRTSPEYLATQNIRQAMNQPTQTGLSAAEANSLIQGGYQGNLGRAADAPGAAYYSKLLQSGQMTPQQFIDALKGSDEFKNKTTASALTDQDKFYQYTPYAGGD